jgi:hypothetical protein
LISGNDQRVEWWRVALHFLLIDPVVGVAHKLGVIFLFLVIGVPLGGLAWWFRDSIAPTLGISHEAATNIFGACFFVLLVGIAWLRSR